MKCCASIKIAQIHAGVVMRLLFIFKRVELDWQISCVNRELIISSQLKFSGRFPKWVQERFIGESSVRSFRDSRTSSAPSHDCRNFDCGSHLSHSAKSNKPANEFMSIERGLLRSVFTLREDNFRHFPIYNLAQKTFSSFVYFPREWKWFPPKRQHYSFRVSSFSVSKRFSLP